MVEDVWNYHGTRSEPLPSLEWWKTSETATALGRNYHQVWKTSRTATALSRNHYPVWNSRRRLRLLRHLVGTTTMYGLVEDVRDCYGTRLEPLPNMVMGGRDCYGIWPRSFVGLRWLDSWSTKSWAQNILRWCLIPVYVKEAEWFQGECLYPTTSTSPRKSNLMTNGTRWMRGPDGRGKKNKKWNVSS